MLHCTTTTTLKQTNPVYFMYVRVCLLAYIMLIVVEKETEREEKTRFFCMNCFMMLVVAKFVVSFEIACIYCLTTGSVHLIKRHLL